MARGLVVRAVVFGIVVVPATIYLWFGTIGPTRATLLVTIVIAAVTATYAFFTYEILLQNRAMARAATESARLMEQSLRFSFAPNLLFLTVNTKDPTFAERPGCSPVQNDDYERALREHRSGGQQKEYVFAVVRNVGRGTATKISVQATYDIRESENPNNAYTLSKQCSVQLLEPNNAIALFIFVAKVPTTDDRVGLLSASVRASDFYKDALSEAETEYAVSPGTHTVESEPDCILPVA